MPKVHKTPTPVRPVVSYSGTRLYAIGVWCDDKLQQVATQQRCFFRSSYQLLKALNTLVFPPGARLFTADAKAMYTNIKIGPCLQVINTYLKNNEERFPNVPRKALFEALSIVMRNNFFTFGDTIWHQQNGCALTRMIFYLKRA
jgi:hypothetical protein